MRTTSLAVAMMALSIGIFGFEEFARADGQVMFDEDMAVPAHGSQARGFTTSAALSFRLEATGLKNANKGFDVLVIPEAAWEGYKKASRAPGQIEAFHGLAITSVTKTAVLPAGSWYVVVHNKYNLLKGMTVHLKGTLNP